MQYKVLVALLVLCCTSTLTQGIRTEERLSVYGKQQPQTAASSSGSDGPGAKPKPSLG